VKDPVAFGINVLGEYYTPSVKRVMRSVRDNTVTIAKSANATGKSHGAARIAVWYYLVYPESKVFVTAAPPMENLKRIVWGEIMSIVTKHPELFIGHKIRTLSIARSPDSFIAGWAIPTSGTAEEREAKFSGKHAPHLLFIIDEGDAVPDEVYAGIESCISGGHSRMLVMFNPRAQSGPVYMKERNHLAKVVHLSALEHPNVITGTDRIPGAVNRETTVRRINDWTRPMAQGEHIDASCFEVPDFLVNATAIAPNGQTYSPLQAGYRKITEPSFHYMVLGEYPAQSYSQLISSEWIDAARTRYDR
jgi:hypothetical protein